MEIRIEPISEVRDREPLLPRFSQLFRPKKNPRVPKLSEVPIYDATMAIVVPILGTKINITA